MAPINILCRALIEDRSQPNPNTGCWTWMGARQSGGYGQIQIAGKSWLAHRASWTTFRGQIPQGLNVLHHCDNRICVNPPHLFIGTQRDNWQDALEKGRITGEPPESARTKARVRRLDHL